MAPGLDVGGAHYESYGGGTGVSLVQSEVAGRGRLALHQQDWIVFRLASSEQHSLAYNRGMANLTLVYGLRLLPSDEVEAVGEAPIKLKNGREAHVTMHTLEGSKDEIEKQLKTSLAAFFDIYPEI
jgi:hypothetical protein